jgi:hypothetical protein
MTIAIADVTQRAVKRSERAEHRRVERRAHRAVVG